MKRKRKLIIIAFAILSVNSFGQIAYYNSIDLVKGEFAYSDGDTIRITPNDDALKILANYSTKSKPTRNELFEEFKDNPFFKLSKIRINPQDEVPPSKLPWSAIGGLDVSPLAQGLSQFMIERAKQELNVAFFEKFKKFAEENEEIKYLFPITSERLSYLISYHYTEMLTQLREGFYEDLNALPENTVRFLEECEDFETLRKSNPEFLIAINSIKLFRQIEYLSPPELINQLPSLMDGTEEAKKKVSDNPKKIKSLENFESTLKLSAIFSKSLQDTSKNRHWVSSNDFYKNIISDSITFNIYLGLVYQNILTKNIKINGNNLSDSLTNDIVWYKNRVTEFIYLTNKVDYAFSELKKLNSNEKKINNSQINSYVNTTLEIASFGNKFAERYSTKELSFKNYLEYANDANNIYRYTYQEKYSSAILASVELFEKLVPTQVVSDSILKINITISAKDLKIFNEKLNKGEGKYNAVLSFDETNSSFSKNKKFINQVVKTINSNLEDLLKEEENKQKDTDLKNIDNSASKIIDSVDIYEMIKDEIVAKKKANDWVRKFNTYGTFMANMVDAQTPEDVNKILTSTALPVGSSSIKKNSKFNIAVASYLGANIGNYRVNNNDSINMVWNSSVNVSAPVGVSFGWGLQPSWAPKLGSISATAVLLDIGAIVDYQLSNDSTTIESKITLGNIFSPGVFISYGMGWNIPLSIGFNIQYGPGLIGVNDSNTSIINAPNWRYGCTIAVDIPLFNLYNSPRKNY